MKKDNCKGCRIAPHCNINDATAKTCPCGICIIKMVCADACEVFEKWHPPVAPMGLNQNRGK